ncbi:hypothetical protein [Marinobacter sp. ELB17]|uniref:hypothetical protein n=1 Tax=Marinobacter sp. ELB17 TaxID=270374 RepID=UPI0000F381D2|nr:hypothetical protein [Marinobacter sp. ELB17]EAZ98131.1 hypothetical protein MELB17_09613 [Marinobacter sp. ELB17]
MARTHDAQAALVALARHADMILDAHLNNGNRLRETSENRAILETLEHHRLVWRYRDDDDPDPNLNKDLIHLLIHITGAQRRRWASEQIQDLWGALEELFKDYHEAKRLGAYADKERLESTIKEHLNIIIEDIRSATETYVGYLNSGFSYVTDLELRMRENERAISRAGKLNALFDSFNIRELADQAGNDPFLRRLLRKHLPAALEEGRKNLVYALHQLRLMLVRMREDQRLSKLVGGFEEYFANTPGFIPSIANLDLDYCPPRLNITSVFHIDGQPDIYDPSDEEALIAMAEAVRTSKTSEPITQETERAESISNDREGAVELNDNDPMDLLAERLVLHIVYGNIGNKEIRALDVFNASGLIGDAATWLHTIESELAALPGEDRECVDVSYHTHPHLTYPDNISIHDMTLRQANVGSAI